MTLVLDKLKSILPPGAKSSPSGWTSFNAPCCAQRGHKPDRRKRGGVRFNTGFVYNCFNCKFTASWQPGRQISAKLRSLCMWLGANEQDIQQLVFEALKTESLDYEPQHASQTVEFEGKKLPEGALPVSEWIEEELDSETEQQLALIIEYVHDRGFNPASKNFYWSPLAGYSDRVILPFYYRGRLTGYTARKVTAGKPKYLSEQSPHFVFNADAQMPDQRYVFVCEGPFDALSIGGVALLTNSIHDQQARIIRSLAEHVIVIPDQDEAGMQLIDKAVEHDFAVAFPNWDTDVKDVNDAVNKYGELFVLVDAIKTAQAGSIKIEMAKRKLKQRLLNEKVN